MKTYGLIGKNISYSFSRNYFKNKFKHEDIKNTQYINFELDNINQVTHLLNNNNYGFNVTIPYKEAVIPFLNSLDNHAQKIGAVNTIQIKNNHTKGFNTDWIGFKKSIEPLLQSHHTKALVLGTGGASKAIKYALDQLGIIYKTVSRTNGDFTYSDLTQEIIEEHLLIINCTPLGTFPNIQDFPNIPYQYINQQHLAYDLIYNPDETTFLLHCKKQGAAVKNGLEMLEIQAEEAWEIWNN